MGQVLRLMARLPLKFLQQLGTVLGWTMYGMSPTYRRHVRENLAAARYDDARLRRRAIAAAGQMITELPALWLRPHGEVVALVRQVEGVEAAFAAQRAGKRAPVACGFQRRARDVRRAEARRSGRLPARPGARRRRRRMERILRPGGLYDDAGGEARRTRQRRLLSRLRETAAARGGLFARAASALGRARGRERHAPAQPRAGGAHCGMPRAVPVGLQPLQDARRGAAETWKVNARVSRIVFALMWLIHGLPFRALAAVGNAVGAALFWLIPERRRVTRINLEKCFPQMAPEERERLARAAFRAFCRSFIDRAVLWWGSDERIRRMVRLEGLGHLDAAAPRA